MCEISGSGQSVNSVSLTCSALCLVIRLLVCMLQSNQTHTHTLSLSLSLLQCVCLCVCVCWPCWLLCDWTMTADSGSLPAVEMMIGWKSGSLGGRKHTHTHTHTHTLLSDDNGSQSDADKCQYIQFTFLLRSGALSVTSVPAVIQIDSDYLT